MPIGNTEYIEYVNAWQAKQACVNNQFVTFQGTPSPVAETKSNTKEDTMNEFYSERNALETAARKTYRERSEENKKKFHLTPEQPTTTREAFEWYSKGYFKKLEDKELDRKLCAYEPPFEKIEFRKHEPDQDGYAKADAQDMAAFEQDLMYIRALPPSEALTKTRTIH